VDFRRFLTSGLRRSLVFLFAEVVIPGRWKLIKPEARRMNPLDERIDQYQSMDWTFGRRVVHD
jgi:hypothetical protein